MCQIMFYGYRIKGCKILGFFVNTMRIARYVDKRKVYINYGGGLPTVQDGACSSVFLDSGAYLEQTDLLLVQDWRMYCL